MKRRTLITVLLGLGIQAAMAAPFVLTGTIRGAQEGDLLILSRIDPVQLLAKDTFRLAGDGDFRFEGEEEASSIYYLTVNKTNNPGIPVILEGGAKVKVEITLVGDPTYTVTGGLHNADMHALYGLFTGYEKVINGLNKEYGALESRAASEEEKQEFNQRYADLIKERRDTIEEFILGHPSSPVSYFACRFLFSRPDTRLVIRTVEKLTAEYPESEYTIALAEFRNSLGKAIEGAIAPDIRLPDRNGDTISLHSLRGKVVLIDFWASWCGPCRQENPSVVKLYEHYKDQGFEIFGVSLDDNHKKWTTAILQDKLTWTHVSDLKGWSSSAGRLYGVRSIPQTFLLDKEGRIHRVGLRSHQLEPVIQDLLSRP